MFTCFAGNVSRLLGDIKTLGDKLTFHTCTVAQKADMENFVRLSRRLRERPQVRWLSRICRIDESAQGT
jgi:hypothetical protein